MSTKYDDSVIEKAFKLHHTTGYSQTKIAYVIGVSPRTINRWLNDEKYVTQFAEYYLQLDVTREQKDDNDLSTYELQAENVRLAKKAQKLQDANRIERKGFREQARSENTIETLNAALVDLLKTNKFTTKSIYTKKLNKDKVVGVLQLSDLHFNELISDINGNSFDFTIASQRLQKYVDKAKNYFIAHGVTSVAVFLCGDLLNSDRRLSEITSAATNRSKAIFLAVDILQQLLRDLLEDFHVTVASVTGNESRVGEYVQWNDLLASDSYDIVIHNFLSYLFANNKNIKFIKVEDSLECVVDVNGVNFLLVHGHGHRGLANTSNIEKEVTAIKAKYASRGVKVDYVVCGHIHSAYVSDNFSRNSGLPGSNSYSERALNLMGKASQNIHLVWRDGTIDSIKVDLQEYKEYSGYPFNETLQTYFKDSTANSNVSIIQSVLI